MKKLITGFLISLLMAGNLYAADTKGSALPTATPVGTDKVYFVDDPGGTPSSKAATFTTLFNAMPSTSLSDTADLMYRETEGLVNLADVNSATATVGFILMADGTSFGASEIDLPDSKGADSDSTTTQSDSGLELIGRHLTLLRGCADNEILKWDETQDDWNCEADGGGAGSTAYDDITAPDADSTVNFTTYTNTWTSTINGGQAFSIINGTTDLTSDTDLIRLVFEDDGDANGYFIRGFDNNGVDQVFSIGADGSIVSAGSITAGGSNAALVLPETTAPATSASEGALYTKDTAGQPELFFREESSGDEVQITSGGSVVGGGSLTSLSDVNSATAVKGTIIVTDGNNWHSLNAAGTDDFVITADAAQPFGVKWAAVGAASDTNSVKEYWWPAVSTLALEAADSVAPINKLAGTNVDVQVASYDDGTDECRNVNFKIPSDVTSGSTITFRLIWFSSTATSGNVIWDFRHTGGDTEGEDWDSALTTEASAADAVQGTTDQITVTTWTETLANTGWAANDLVTAEVCRDANHASDTLVGDAHMIGFGTEIPRD